MSVGSFAILAFVDPIGIVTTPSGMEILESQGRGSLCWTLGGATRGNDANFGDFGIMTPLDESVLP